MTRAWDNETADNCGSRTILLKSTAETSSLSRDRIMTRAKMRGKDAEKAKGER